MIARWVRVSRDYPGRIAAVAGLLAALGAWGTARLYADLRPDITELLPQQARSVHDMQAVSGRVGGWAVDTIILHGAPAEAMRRFADDLAVKLQVHVPSLLRRVEYRVDDMTAFFHDHRWLFPPLADLEAVRDRLRARLAWEKERANPLYVSLDDDEPPGFADLRARMGKLGAGIKQFGEGYYTGEVAGLEPGSRQEIVVLLARIAGTAENFDLVTQVDHAVRTAVAELQPSTYAPTLQVAYGGDVASAILEHDALAEDLTVATLLVIVVVAISLALYYHTWKAIFIVGLPLTVGTLITFGIAELVVGHLNSNTAFLGSIVIGNGINVGLVFFARYLEERRANHDPEAAMITAIRGTYLATLTASMAAGISYASLMTTQSRGFSQFGLVGGLGMALCWLTAYALMPAVCMAWERRAPLVQAARRVRRNWLVGQLAEAVERAPRAILLAAAGVSVLALVSVPGFVRDPIENDFSHLRNQQAMLPDHPGWWDERVDDLFGDHLTPTVLMCHDQEEAAAVAAALMQARDANPNHTTLGTVVSAASFLPAQQEEKLKVLQEINATLQPDQLAWVPASARRQLDVLRPPPDLKPFSAQDLPVSLKDRLTESDGRFGTMVLLYPKPSLNVWDGRDVIRFARELRSLSLPRPDIPTAGSILVFADMLAAMAQDGPKATVLSLVGVAVLVLVMFIGGRRHGYLWDATLVLTTLVLGVVWFVGLAAVMHLKVNMLNFIAFPITFGIGADYATNLVQRRRQDIAMSIGDCLRTTGGAVALCSWTTIVGYGSLLVARNQALVSFGLLAVLGEVACLAAALWPLAAYLQTRRQRGLS